MSPNDALAWIDEVVSSTPPGPFVVTKGQNSGLMSYDEVVAEAVKDLFSWHARASNCVQGLVPAGALIQLWRDASAVPDRTFADPLPFRHQLPRMKGVLAAIRNEIANGRLQTFEQSVQASTVAEVLDQAEHLQRNNYLAAAAVLTGGALETHLRHLCDRAGILTPSADGLSDYLGLLDQSRKAGNELVSAGDTQQARAWAKRRNDAAHDPANFKATKETIELMIDGVRHFMRIHP